MALTFKEIEKQGDNVFIGHFQGRPAGSAGQQVSLFTITVKCKCKKSNFFEFWRDCDDPDIIADLSTGEWIDTSVTPEESWKAYPTLMISDASGACMKVICEWKVWKDSATTVPHPLHFTGDVELPFGAKGKGNFETIPDLSGKFTITVCCKKSEEGCVCSISL